MGWVGAQRDGALLKYAELLAAHGYSSVRSVQPTATAFSPLASGRRRWALGMMAFLQQQALWPQRRLVFYAFSNGGLRWRGLAMPLCKAARLLLLLGPCERVSLSLFPDRCLAGGAFVVEQLMLLAQEDPR